MKRTLRALATFPALLLPICASAKASAQTATVTLSSQKQYIRGFGGMSHAAWAGDLTAAERTLAFGNGDGQLGFSVLRIPVTDGSPDSANVATAKAAIAAGAIVFATPWNAVGTMTSSQFSSYATHLNNFVSYMKNQGVSLYAISVQNEPDYASTWLAWTPTLCHDFILNYGATITTKLISCESFNYAKSYYDPILNDSAALANVATLGTHLYGTPVSSYPYSLFEQKGAGKERWMTEHYTDSTTDANSWPNALGVATELHHAMVDAQFNLYTWWYIVRSYGPISTNGTVSKRGWCMAQFSKFIRPGFYRVDATASPTNGVYLSAYKSNTEVVVVAVNTNSSATSLTVSINGSSISSYDRFTTSGSKSLANDGKVSASNGTLTLSLDAQSVTTLHGTGSSMGAGGTGGATTGAGGTAGTGGSFGSGGVTGTAGAKGSGGVAGTGGLSGAGGLAATGGSTGSGGSTSTGDSRGTGGSPSTGGSNGSGGLAGGTGGGTGNVGGAPNSSGGAPGTGGETAGETSGNGGCSCRVDSNQAVATPLAMFVMLGLLTLLSRRRRGGQPGSRTESAPPSSAGQCRQA
jgi:glucuronoarabinoxylan endo-1,4-beta-xylanase